MPSTDEHMDDVTLHSECSDREVHEPLDSVPLEIPAPEPGEETTAIEKRITTEPNVKILDLPDHDPQSPKNWSKAKRWYITICVAWTCFVVALCSSIVTADFPGVEETFHVSEEVALLTVTLFVIGFGVGMFISSAWVYVLSNMMKSSSSSSSFSLLSQLLTCLV